MRADSIRVFLFWVFFCCCSELGNVILAARFSRYQSPVPEPPALPPKPTQEASSSLVGDRESRQIYPVVSGDLPQVVGLQQERDESEIHLAPRQENLPGNVCPNKGHHDVVDEADSLLQDSEPMSKQFESVLSFVSRPWMGEEDTVDGKVVRARGDPVLASLMGPEPLDSLPVREKLYCHVSGKSK